MATTTNKSHARIRAMLNVDGKMFNAQHTIHIHVSTNLHDEKKNIC